MSRESNQFIRIRKILHYQRDYESRSRQTANVNLYRVTKFLLNLCFTVHYFYPKISSFTLVCFVTIVLDCFQLHVFCFEKFSTCHESDILPFAVNVTLDLSIVSSNNSNLEATASRGNIYNKSKITHFLCYLNLSFIQSSNVINVYYLYYYGIKGLRKSETLIPLSFLFFQIRLPNFRLA